MNKSLLFLLIFFHCVFIQCRNAGSDNLLQLSGKCLPEVANNSSTSSLIANILTYPSLSVNYMISSNSSPIGTCYRIYSEIGTVDEFEKRKDRFEALKEFYGAICFDCVPRLNSIEKMDFSIQLTVIEVLFTRDSILHSLSRKQKQDVVAMLLKKYNEKLKDREISIIGSVTVMAWIMYSDKYSPIMNLYKNNEMSIEWFDVTSDKIDNVITFAVNYIKK